MHSTIKANAFLLLISSIVLISSCSVLGIEKEERGGLRITAFLGQGGDYNVQSTLETNIPGYPSVETDSEGVFVFKDIKAGKYNITTINRHFGRCLHEDIGAPGRWALPVDATQCP